MFVNAIAHRFDRQPTGSRGTAPITSRFDRMTVDAMPLRGDWGQKIYLWGL
jgi:hypothetical protein